MEWIVIPLVVLAAAGIGAALKELATDGHRRRPGERDYDSRNPH